MFLSEFRDPPVVVNIFLTLLCGMMIALSLIDIDVQNVHFSTLTRFLVEKGVKIDFFTFHN